MSDLHMNLKSRLQLTTVKDAGGVDVLDKSAPFPSSTRISEALLKFAKDVLPAVLGPSSSKAAVDFLRSFGDALENRHKLPGGKALNQGSVTGRIANDVYEQAAAMKFTGTDLDKVFIGISTAMEVLTPKTPAPTPHSGKGASSPTTTPVPASISDDELFKKFDLSRMPDGSAMLMGVPGGSLNETRERAQTLANQIGGTVNFLGNGGVEPFHPKKA